MVTGAGVTRHGARTPVSTTRAIFLAFALSVSTAAHAQDQPYPNALADATPAFEFADGRIGLGADFTFAGVHDEAQRAAMGRERQIAVAYAILALRASVSEHVTFRVEANPAQNDRVPVPYTPLPSDRRTYFFPNQPEGRGAVSDPAGLYKVDYYKHPGLDPIIQQNALRLAYIDLHTVDRRLGLRVGRFVLPRGLGLGRATWFTAKDLSHIQSIDLAADSGAMLYYGSDAVRVSVAGVTGNSNPYHDYGYFDFTDPTEDKNSALGLVVAGRAHLGRVTAGASYQWNRINSRIEDATTLQLSKRNDNAVTVFGSVQANAFVRLFGQYSRYTWGLAASSAELLAGPPITTPIVKTGTNVGVALISPETPIGRWGASVLYEDLSRDDSLVAWASAQGLFGVTLGARERSTIVKVYHPLNDNVTAFFFLNRLANPFPELSALRPISGPLANRAVSGTKVGFGMRLRIGGGGEHASR